MDIDRCHRDLDDARSRLRRCRYHDESQPPGEKLAVELQTLRAAEDEIGTDDELQHNHSLDDQQLWRYQTLFDAAPAAYVTTDDNGLITDVNGAAQHLFQRAAERLVRTPMSVLIDARDRRDFRLVVSYLARQPGQSQLRLRVEMTPDEKAEVWASVSTGLAATREPELRWILQRTEPQRAGNQLVEAVNEITTLFASAGDVDDVLSTLCEWAVEIVDAKASSVVLVDEHRGQQAVGASDRSTAVLEGFEVENTQGPCIEALRTNSVIMIDDLDHHAGSWPGFVRQARKQHLRSVLSVPLRVGSDAIGAFSLLDSRLMAFGACDVLIAEALANLTAFGIVSRRALDRSQQTVTELQHALNSRIVIEQAKGMLAAEVGVSPSMAFEALRGYARSNGRRLHQVCEELINGNLPVKVLEVSHRHGSDNEPGG